MDVVDALRLACLGAGLGLLGLSLTVVAGRVRHDRRMRRGARAPVATPATIAVAAGEEGTPGEWKRGEALLQLVEQRHQLSDRLLRHAIRSDDTELRHTAVTALGVIAQTEDWAVDLLLEALAEERDSAVRLAAQLDRAAPRVGRRLLPLLSHPAPSVRAVSARLLVRYPGLCGPELIAATHDPSPDVRAAVLDTMATVGGPAALRTGVALLRDTDPKVRGRAIRAAASLGGLEIAPFLVPALADPSWWVREAAVNALTALGPTVGTLATTALGDDDPLTREGAARVLQGSGALEALSPSVYADLVARIAALSTPRESTDDREAHEVGLP